jgi:hypothetical protein
MNRGIHADSEAVHHAYGEAALFLVEALLLTLVERGVLTSDEMIEAIDTAIRTKRQSAEDGVHVEVSVIAAALVTRIGNTLGAITADGRGRRMQPESE